MPANRKNVLTFAECEKINSTRRSNKLAGHTYLVRIDDDTYAVRLYSTDIVRIHRDGTYELNSGGYMTDTTKRRINEFAPVHVYARGGEWYLSGHVLFVDRMLTRGDGTALRVSDVV